jgi:transposase
MPSELLAALADKCYYLAMELSARERVELRALANGSDVSARIATRARIVLWSAEGRMKKDIAVLAGVSRPTVDFWIDRYGSGGVAALNDRPSGAPREQVPPAVRGRILALTRCTPPVELGLSHWSSREMADFLNRTEGIAVSHNYVATVWREAGLKPWQAGTFKLSRDPAFAEKVADVVGLYLDPPGGAVVLSIDEKTQVQALDRTQPTLPLDFGKTAKQTHDYVRHGTTNLFAALNVHTGEVFGECKQTRNGQDFLDFLKRAVKPHAGKSIHVVLDNLSTPRNSRRARMARQEPAHYLPFHAGRLILAQPGGDLVRSNNSSGHPTGYVRIGHSTDQEDQGLHCPLERRCEAVRVDCHRRRDSREGQDRPGERQETGRQQL